jgi:hypothetical protein
MGRCEFPQPRSSSGGGVRPAWLGGQTGPAQRGAVRPAWLGGSTAPPPHRFLGGVVFEVVSREVSVLEVVLLVVGLVRQ